MLLLYFVPKLARVAVIIDDIADIIDCLRVMSIFLIGICNKAIKFLK